MQINSLHIDGFGKWNDRDFAFNDQLQIISGDNEAGKTTLSRFIISILFGFANGHQQYQQYLPKNSNAYGGTLKLNVDGTEINLKRSQGKNGGKVEITDDRGDKLPNTFLERTLGPIDQKMYESIYVFSQNELNQIFDLKREDLVAYLQKMGAVGSGEWLNAKKELEKQADSLYKPRGRNPLLNTQLKEYEQLTEEIHVATGKYDRYQQLEESIAHSKTELSAVEDKRTVAQTRYTQLSELSPLMPIFERLNDADKPEQDVAIQPEDVAKVQNLNTQIENATQQLTDLKAELSNLEIESDQSTFDNFYGEHRELVSGIMNEIPTAKVNIESREALTNKIADWEAQKQSLLRLYDVESLPEPLSNEDKLRYNKLSDQASQSEHQPVSESAGGFSVPIWDWVASVIGLLLLAVGSTVLRIVGILVIVAVVGAVYANHNSKMQSAKNRARERQHSEDQVQAQIESFGVNHGLNPFKQNQWLSMQGDLTRYAELISEIDTANQQLASLNSTIATFAEKLNQNELLAESLKTTVQLDQLNEQLKQASQHYQQNRDKIQRQELLQQQIQRQTQLQQQAGLERTQLLTSFGVNDEKEFNQLYHHYLDEQANQQTNQVMASQLSDEQTKQLSEFSNAEDLTVQTEHVKSDLDQLTAQIEILSRQITNDQLEIDNLAQNGSLTVLQQKRANLETQITDTVKQWLQHQLAAEWIDHALALASADRFPQIINRAKDYFSQLTGGHYATINLNDELIYVTDQHGQQFDVGELSTGTAQQLYTALRFGFVQVMGDIVDLPIMVDDGFITFDAQRKQTVMKVLQDISKDHQVIYFTVNQATSDNTINLNEV